MIQATAEACVQETSLMFNRLKTRASNFLNGDKHTMDQLECWLLRGWSLCMCLK